MMNHESSRAATDVSYEYFTDSFAVVLDDQPVKKVKHRASNLTLTICLTLILQHPKPNFNAVLLLHS